MNFFKNIKNIPSKKILAIALSIVLGVAAVSGIVIAVQKTTAQSVLVVPASSVNYGGYYYNENYMSGEVTSDVSQNVYLSDVETVSEILVEEGQAVHIGDVLMTYDTTRTSIALEKELLNKERIELQIRAANKNLEILSGISPVSDSDFDMPVDFDDFDDLEEPEEEDYTDKPKHSVLDETVDPINMPAEESEDGENLLGSVGTQDNPLVFLTSDETVTLTDAFIERWKQYAADHEMENLYICIKRVDEDGTLISAWVQDVCLLPALTFQVSMLDGSISFTPEELAALIALASEAGSDTLEQVLVYINEKYPDLLSNMTDEQLLRIFVGLDETTRDRFIKILTSLSGQDDPETPSDDDNDKPSDDDSKSDDKKSDSDDTNPGGDTDTPGGDDNNPGGDTDTPGGDSNPGSDTDTPGGDSNPGSDTDTPGSDSDTPGSDTNAPGSENETSGSGTGTDTTTARITGYPGTRATASVRALRASYILDRNALQLLASADRAEDDGGASSASTLLISPDASYTREELAEAKKNERDKIEELQLDLRESELKIKDAQKAVESGMVTARINGVVKYVGDPEKTGIGRTKMIEVVSAEGLFVQSAMPENMLQTVREGDIVTVTSWQSGGVYEAEVREISQYPDSSNRYTWSEYSTQSYYPFIAYIAEGGNSLSNGEWVEITYDESINAHNHVDDSITGDEISENDDSIENDGTTDITEIGITDDYTIYSDLYLWKVFIREEGSQKYVYARGDNGKLEKRYIEVGELSDSSYRVLSGLTEDDYIAFPYGSNVKEGAPTREGSVDELYQ